VCSLAVEYVEGWEFLLFADVWLHKLLIGCRQPLRTVGFLWCSPNSSNLQSCLNETHSNRKNVWNDATTRSYFSSLLPLIFPGRGSEIKHCPRILSLDGGGIRGLSSLLILKEIMEEVQRQTKAEETH
jgi:hypothetical protein